MAETVPRSVRYDGEYFHHFNISSPWLLAILFSPALRVCGLRLPRCSSLRFCHPPSPWEHLVCYCCPPRLAHCQRLRKPSALGACCLGDFWRSVDETTHQFAFPISVNWVPACLLFGGILSQLGGDPSPFCVSNRRWETC